MPDQVCASGARAPMTMADAARAQKFGDSLLEAERSGDTGALLAQFSEDATLARPELDHSRAPGSDADGFWTTYLAQFTDLGTEFSRVAEAEDIAVLEWTTKGTLATGRPIEYAGVSLLTFGEDDLVVAFATYYDTAAFTTPAA